VTEYCEHVSAIEPVAPTSKGCEDCLAIGASWTELRVCLTCGHVGCCEDSEHAHALRHFNATGHPVIEPLARSETWGWCYIHKRYFDPMPAARSPRGSMASMLTAFFSRFGKTNSR
jgi:uncharacterized UBP type Zn finger protein